MSLLLKTLTFWCIFFACTMPVHSASLDELSLPGPVIEGHAKVEIECAKCHKKFDKGAQTGLCSDCHKEVARDFREKRGYHGRLKEEKACKDCHTEHKGRNAKLAIFDTDKFDHSQTDFQLKGGHLNEKAQCKSCHLEKTKYREAPSVCNACHKKDDKHKGKLGADCTNCHVEKGWKATTFDHNKANFKLLGKHVNVNCKSCHIGDGYKDTPKQCSACHKKDDQEKGHKGRLGDKCETCHSEEKWKSNAFNHDNDTKFPLRDKHKAAKCDVCHKGGLTGKDAELTTKLERVCVVCHKKDDQEKGHQGGMGGKCETCHIEKEWKASTFDHGVDTKFPLRDKHQMAKCDACHKSVIPGNKAELKLEKECFACHKKDDQEKGHKGGVGSKCETCHSEKEWKASTFDHGIGTKFPLRDKHKSAKCDACHKGEISGNKADLKLVKECFACHEKDDKHKEQLGIKCDRCHNEKRWQNALYDHTKARFILTGTHLKAECKKCHLTPTSYNLPLACGVCHEKNDAHKKRFGAECANCHYTDGWKNLRYRHDQTRFKQDGMHKKVKCVVCHQGQVETAFNTPKACVDCHKEEVHSYGSQCERCHTTSNWTQILKGGLRGY